MFLTTRAGLLLLLEGVVGGIIFGILGFERGTRYLDEEFVLLANAFLVLCNSVYLLAAGVFSGDTIKIKLYNLLYHGCAAGFYVTTAISYFRLHVNKDEHMWVAGNALALFGGVIHVVHMILALKGSG